MTCSKQGGEERKLRGFYPASPVPLHDDRLSWAARLYFQFICRLDDGLGPFRSHDGRDDVSVISLLTRQSKKHVLKGLEELVDFELIVPDDPKDRRFFIANPNPFSVYVEGNHFKEEFLQRLRRAKMFALHDRLKEAEKNWLVSLEGPSEPE
jgi:hypothetical protein